jgi:hypothetical protein
MKVILIVSLICCSFVYNLKLKVKNEIEEFQKIYGNTPKFVENIFSDKGKIFK